MTVSLDRQGRERVDELKNQKDNGKKYIYESPDNGKTIYRREIKNYDDVSGVKLDCDIDWQEEAMRWPDPPVTDQAEFHGSRGYACSERNIYSPLFSTSFALWLPLSGNSCYPGCG